jgi:hypothetical protein
LDAGRPLQPELDWPFFDADFAIPAEMLAQVQVQAITYPPTS